MNLEQITLDQMLNGMKVFLIDHFANINSSQSAFKCNPLACFKVQFTSEHVKRQLLTLLRFPSISEKWWRGNIS